MTLSEAQNIATSPSAYSPAQWQEALDRLYRSRNNQHTDRAQERYDRRVQRLRDYLAGVSTSVPEPFKYDQDKMFPFATSRHTMTD